MKTPRDIADPLDRVTWRDGQLLAAADLRDGQNSIDRLRHLHIRYQHGTWGIVEGLNVVATGLTRVRVGRGYALDIEGRELLLPATAEIDVPAGSTAKVTMYLVISWGAPQCGCSHPPDLTLLCPGAKAAHPVEQGVLAWKTVGEVRMGHDILLARALISMGKLASKIDMSVARHARSMGQSHMWSDVTLAGQTGWADRSGALREVVAEVDTSDAGFVSTPAYFAWLSGAGSHIAQSFISEANAARFTFVLRPATLAQGFKTDKTMTAAQAEDAGLSIAWFAIEIQRGLWI